MSSERSPAKAPERGQFWLDRRRRQYASITMSYALGADTRKPQVRRTARQMPGNCNVFLADFTRLDHSEIEKRIVRGDVSVEGYTKRPCSVSMACYLDGRSVLATTGRCEDSDRILQPGHMARRSRRPLSIPGPGLPPELTLRDSSLPLIPFLIIPSFILEHGGCRKVTGHVRELP